MALAMPQEATLLVPVVEGNELAAKISWTNATRVLHVAWPIGGKLTMAFDKPVNVPHRKPEDYEDFTYQEVDFLSPTERAICDCWNEVYGGTRYNSGKKEHFECRNAYGSPDHACVQKWYGKKSECAQLISCIWHDPAAAP
jgi:hypothetical protein